MRPDVHALLMGAVALVLSTVVAPVAAAADTRESLREVYGVEVTVTEVTPADGRTARVCIPALGERGILPGHPGHPS